MVSGDAEACIDFSSDRIEEWYERDLYIFRNKIGEETWRNRERNRVFKYNTINSILEDIDSPILEIKKTEETWKPWYLNLFFLLFPSLVRWIINISHNILDRSVIRSNCTRNLYAYSSPIDFISIFIVTIIGKLVSIHANTRFISYPNWRRIVQWFVSPCIKGKLKIASYQGLWN